jgi:type II secretory pathway pseudopilin PulG
MRMPRVLFTVRGLMIAVAVVAILLGALSTGLAWKRKSDRYRQLAARYAQAEAMAIRSMSSEDKSAELSRRLDEIRARLEGPRRAPVQKLTLFGYRLLPKRWNPDEKEYEEMQNEKKERDRLRIAWLAHMRKKYERAARSPWLPVAPDPPNPE